MRNSNIKDLLMGAHLVSLTQSQIAINEEPVNL